MKWAEYETHVRLSKFGLEVQMNGMFFFYTINMDIVPDVCVSTEEFFLFGSSNEVPTSLHLCSEYIVGGLFSYHFLSLFLIVGLVMSHTLCLFSTATVFSFLAFWTFSHSVVIYFLISRHVSSFTRDLLPLHIYFALNELNIALVICCHIVRWQALYDRQM
jgi:hypothetical protein